MTVFHFVSGYIALNILVALAFILLKALSKVQLRARDELRLHYFMVAAVLATTAFHFALPQPQNFTAAAKIWSAESITELPSSTEVQGPASFISIPSFSHSSGMEVNSFLSLLFGFIGIFLLFGGIRFFKEIRSLQRVRSQSIHFRRWKNLRIFLNDQLSVPFSFWMPGVYEVHLPLHLLEKPTEMKMILAHEIQHHRQGDTFWLYAFYFLRIFCFANPAIYLWSRWISETQEFACDETLVDLKKVESQQYVRCLLEVAQSAVEQKNIPACAVGFVFLAQQNFLKRRILKMLTLKKLPLRRSILCAFGAMSFILLSSVSYASKALIQDRRITMADAEKMAENAKRNSEFPIVVNDRVLKQLNRFLGTPDGREFISQSMLRMKEYQSLIEKKLEEYDVPHELIAIPLIEAGYKNSPAKKEGKAAGLWMFMPGTAAHYGLKVTREPMKTDERMDVALSTDAAMRLLKANQLRFKDWPLSVLAYNMGEGERGGVQGGINKTNSRDAWTLVERGFENDPDYLPKLMAAILILKNPDTLN